MSMGHVMMPGSYDPITKGHLDVITRVAARFDRVTVAVMTNDMHQHAEGVTPKHYMFTLMERQAIAKAACAHLKNVTVIAAGGQLVRLLETVPVDWIVKGVRNSTDFEYEQKQALWNRQCDPRAETIYIPADPAYDHVSSTLVRAKIAAGEPLEDYLTRPVIDWILAHPRS